MWDTIINFNMHVKGVQKGSKRDKGPEKVFGEVKGKNIPNLLKDKFIDLRKSANTKGG